MKTEVYTRRSEPFDNIISEKDLEDDGKTELDNPFVIGRRRDCARRPGKGSDP
jgi:hypothetical protein